MAGNATDKRATTIDQGLLHLTVREGDPYVRLSFAGNMGYGIGAVDNALATLGLPGIEEVRASCPSFGDSGWPDYLYEAQVRMDELPTRHQEVLAGLVRESQERQRAHERDRQVKALTPHAKALVARARNLVEERNRIGNEAERKSWELRAEQTLQAFVEELG